MLQRCCFQAYGAQVDLRAEQRRDQAAVRRLHLAAFGDHGMVVADLVDSLRAAMTADSGLSLVALDPEGVVLGHLMFTPGVLDAPKRLVEVQVLSPGPCCPGGGARASALRSSGPVCRS